MRSPLRLFVVLLFAVAVPAHAYRMSAWVPSWDASSIPTMGVHARDLDESNPGWFYANADGTVKATGEDPRLRAALTGTLLMPTIKNYANGSFDGAMMATIVNSETLREKHAEAIAQAVVTNGYDGIDIDYEAMPSSSKAGFSAFVQLLGKKLHASSKQLSVTVHAKTNDATWAGPGAQDWTVIGAAADSVKIMAYDNHWSTSAAGPIAPLDWLDQVAAYAEQKLPAKKAMIGLPWYGYDWLANNGSAVTYAQAIAKAQSSGTTVNYDANGEATFSYGSRTVFFQDATSYRTKVQALVARHPGIGGFAHWRVGAEDPAIWDVVSQLRTTGRAPTQSLPAKDFAIDGPLDMTTAAGTQIRAQYRYVGINGFTGPVTLSSRSIDPFGATVTVSGTSLTVAVASTTATGAYRLMVTMSGGGITHEQLVVVRVTAPKVTRRRAVR
jgi:spore germination protein